MKRENHSMIIKRNNEYSKNLRNEIQKQYSNIVDKNLRKLGKYVGDDKIHPDLLNEEQ